MNKTYAQKIAEAVRDAVITKLSDQHTWLTNVAASSLVFNIDIDAIIASIPRPEPVGYIAKDGLPKLYFATMKQLDFGVALYAAPVSAEPDARLLDEVEDTFTRCASSLVSSDYAKGYKECLLHIRNSMVAEQAHA